MTYLPILLGVAGSIFKTHTTDQLERVGVLGDQLRTLVNQLNVHAVKSLHWIYGHKRKADKRRMPQEEQNHRKRRKRC